MFGYVRIYKPELRIREYEQYEGIYCALCRQLGKRYGILARLVLSYDLTFLALLRIALDEKNCPSFSRRRCTCNPFKKCSFCGENRHIDEAADITAILMYHKLCDTVADEGPVLSAFARLALLLLSGARKKAAKRLPHIDEKVMTAMKRQAEAESANAGTDAAADPTASILAELASMPASSEAEKRTLSRFGYCLGRWIYLIDAVDDMEKDAAKSRFNPFLDGNTKESVDFPALRKSAEASLNASLAECISAYNLLDIRRFDEILRNVLELGLPHVQKLAVAGKLSESKGGVPDGRQRSV